MEDQTVKNPDKGGVQSVARIFELIEVLAAHPAGASLQRLAEDAHLAKSTTHRLLGSLVSLGYAAQDGETGKYRLTLKMFEISSGIVNSMDVMSVAKVHLERLAQRTGEAVHLVIRDAQDIVYIYKTESGPMRMSSRVGLRSPLYCTGVGKAILATLTEEEVEDVWRHSTPQKLTGRTVTDLPALCAQLIPHHTRYTRKMYTVVPQWCPELLKSYEKPRGAIKRYCRYSSISLLFFFAFFDVSCPASFPVAVVFGCSAL